MAPTDPHRLPTPPPHTTGPLLHPSLPATACPLLRLTLPATAYYCLPLPPQTTPEERSMWAELEQLPVSAPLPPNMPQTFYWQLGCQAR